MAIEVGDQYMLKDFDGNEALVEVTEHTGLKIHFSYKKHTALKPRKKKGFVNPHVFEELVQNGYLKKQ
ncbi:hypothetical protein K6L05_00100 [Salinicoccus roseus]|uniref:hypothetical protein n=1 Tax=Salinicoccus roseus TaxID=45670 RepID=UPI001CA74EB4|nr:hypothetical protein [Salinicoccus roseus]MBY8908186.1 hypothetical protein [Salinicoccus roseus]